MTIQEYLESVHPRCPNCQHRLKPTKYGHWLCKGCNSLFEKLENLRVGKELS